MITSTVLGTPPSGGLDRSVRAHLAALYGVPTDGWELLAAHHDPEAVPAMEAPHDPRRPVRVLAGLYVCGDHRDTSTVQGALQSGRMGGGGDPHRPGRPGHARGEPAAAGGGVSPGPGSRRGRPRVRGGQPRAATRSR